MHSILLLDDESLFATTTADFLTDRGFDVTVRSDGFTITQDVAANRFDLLITDLDMPGNRNLELLTFCRSAHPSIPMIVVTGRPTLPSAIESIRWGIHDYLLKPIELDDLLHSIRRALPVTTISTAPTEPFAEILGDDPVTQQMKKLASRIARSQATVLVRGESGTGKELLARGIHAHSARHMHPFVTVDCGAIPEPLVESILFGHVKGAFTGADRDRVGMIKSADQGTLFLDEIGELPLYMQAKLLRVLQFGTFTPVGSSEVQSVDLRIVAATHRNLADEVRKNQFREDLYYRLSVLEIVSPPLRERSGDICQLVEYFADLICRRDHLPTPRIDPLAIELLKAYHWPGNIRELRNVIERCLCRSEDGCIRLSDVQGSLNQMKKLASEPSNADMDMGTSYQSLESFQAEQEYKYVDQLLKRHKGNIAKAALEAGITRQGLHKVIGRLGISPGTYR